MNNRPIRYKIFVALSALDSIKIEAYSYLRKRRQNWKIDFNKFVHCFVNLVVIHDVWLSIDEETL